jgi:hypothetical protein
MIANFVATEEMQDGFIRARDNGILEWTAEEACVRFPDFFDPAVVACAKLRLKLVRMLPPAEAPP